MKRTTVALTLALSANTILAGGLKYKNEKDQYLKLGGRIQFQYHHSDPDGEDAEDDLRFRRLRPYVEGSLHKDWKGKWQWDMGKGGIELKDAYFAYKGIDGLQILFGNANFPFSREFITSSKYQQLVERTFVGDHNYGTPDRQACVHLLGEASDGMITWGASAGKAAQDPDNKKLDFETAVSLEAGDDWSEGQIVGGRVDLHPFGKLKMSQGDMKGDLKATVSVAAFAWQNDDDNLGSDMGENAAGVEERTIGKQDVDKVNGVEVSAALRVVGLSVDAQVNTFHSELVVDGISNGIYEDSEATLVNYAVEGGFMVVPKMVELVAGYQAQDADNYDTAWTRTSVGANYFVKKHDVKYQLTYRAGENKDGKKGQDLDEIFIQAQYVF